jgi:hypothetical protein
VPEGLGSGMLTGGPKAADCKLQGHEFGTAMTRSDSAGQLLDGSQHNCTLTFARNRFPPVNAFWTVTMYDGKKQLLIENPINRYLINSPMLPNLKKNPDGSLT